jgi:hypothetical protein
MATWNRSFDYKPNFGYRKPYPAGDKSPALKKIPSIEFPKGRMLLTLMLGKQSLGVIDTKRKNEWRRGVW